MINTWPDHHGQQIVVSQFSPAIMDAKLHMALMMSHDYAAALRFGSKFENRICTDQLRAMGKSKRYTAWQKSVFEAIPCQAIWCRDDLRAMGYEAVQGPFCEENDGLFYRVYPCQHPDAVEARRKHTEVVEQALAEPQL